MKRLVLLDSHAILHRAYHALPDFATAAGEPTGALYGVSAMLIKIIEQLKPDYIAACYDVKGPTHRHEAFKEYKAQRKQIDDDLIRQINRSRDIFTAMDIPMYDKQGFEADDILGTIVEQMKGNKDIEIVIASGDMDTLQLIDGERVKVYTLKKGLNDTITYDEQTVKDRYGFGPDLIPDYKGLRGDPSDNIPGVKGIGEKTATTLITTFGSIEDMYRELGAGHEEKFAKAGITPRIVQLLKDNKEEAEFSKILATIRLDAPIQYVLPEKTFKETLDLAKVNELWTKLEFRTLSQRLKQVMEGKVQQAPQKRQVLAEPASSPAGDAPTSRPPRAPKVSARTSVSAAPSPNQSMFGADTTNGVDKERLEKVALALGLVNSNISGPQLEDILNFANTENFDEAEKMVYAELDKRNMRRVYEEIELPLIPILHKMEKRGVKIDRAILAKLSKEYHATAEALQKRIWAMAGGEFNISSPKQLGDILFDKLGLGGKKIKKTAGGARSTKESELEKLRDEHAIIPLIFEYRELTKLLGTYIDAIPPLLDGEDRVHTTFIQTGAATGRMATKDPGVQNIPVRSELGRAIRGAFIAEQGYKMVALDYSQMELRIAAFLSGDEKLIDIFRKGEDVHRSVASYVFKVAPDKVDHEMRRRAKIINFGILYGMGVLALKKNLGTTKSEAQKFYDDYFAEFSTLAAYLEGVKAEAAKLGYTETFYGRRRYFEGIRSKLPFIRASAERMAINAPIQGTEADVIKLAMVRVDEYIRKNKLEEVVYPLLQVHDELVYEIKEARAAEVAADIEKIMESVMNIKDTKGVVLEAKASIGNNWGELK